MYINVTKAFGKIIAVEDVNLNVRDGEIVALVGPNGAGKTTLLKLAAGILLPTRGRVLVYGFDAHTKEAKRRVGFMTPMDRGVYWRLTALDNLVFYGTLYGLSVRESKARAIELLREFGLEARANDWVATYSTGMMRRLELARAMMHDPDILLLDEPTSGIDVDGKGIVLEYIRRLRGRKTIVIASHDPQEIELADRVIYLNRRVIDQKPALKIIKVLVKGDVSRLSGFRVTPMDGGGVIYATMDEFNTLISKLASMDGAVKVVDINVEIAQAYADQNARRFERVFDRRRGEW